MRVVGYLASGRGWLPLLLPLLLLPHATAQNDFPAGLGSCYEPLCGVSFSYCSRERNVTLLPYRAAAGAEKICVYVPGVFEDYYCSDPYSDWCASIPGCFPSGSKVHIYEYNGGVWKEWIARHLVREVDPLPEISLASWIHVDTSAFGMLSAGRLFLHYKANPVALSNGDSMELSVLDGPRLTVINSGGNIDSAGSSIEPGSWFYSITPIHTAENASVVTLPNYGYIEFLLDKKEILGQRRFAVGGSPGSVSASVSASGPDIFDGILSGGRQSRRRRGAALSARAAAEEPPIHVCIWGSNKLDGQKSIWINQVQHMGGAQGRQGQFSFTWILTSNSSGPGSLRVLEGLPHPPKIVRSPFENIPIEISDLKQDPGDGSPPFFEMWDRSPEGITEYIIKRLEKTNTNRIEDTSPKWVRDFLVGARDRIAALGCGLMVYGSNRGFSNDALIVIMGKALQIPTVSELLNLFADQENLPDAIIGPSHYSVYHESIAGLLKPDSGVQVEVISPGIDMNRFDIKLRSQPKGQPWRHPKCPHTEDCVVVGYMARISVEKNPGLFVISAGLIHRRHPHVRFVMIGDGLLTDNIKELASLLGILDLFHFPGWLIGDELPRMLAGVDIMLNPSLRAWSETFCIANIEAMAMGIPLVTFAVGGVGEYVSASERCVAAGLGDPEPLVSADWTSYTCSSDTRNPDSVPEFEVVGNAVIMNSAAPEVVLEAVSYLINNPSERTRIGWAGHDTVAKYFSVERQMRQYTSVYRAIYGGYNTKNSR